MNAAFARIALSLLCLIGATWPAQAQRAMNDEQIFMQAKRVARGELVEVFQHGVDIEAAKFLRLAEEAYQGIEKVTGLKFDTATLGPRLQIIVSASAPVSHVWRGHHHQQEPRGILILNAFAYRGAIKANNATYIHGMTQLFTWHYSSHTLHEGLADWVALEVLPGAAVGPNPNGHDPKTVVPPVIADYLGTNQAPPLWLDLDAERRAAYYFASYRFVKYLIDTKGFATFMQLYNSPKPDASFAKLYDTKRETAIRAARL